MTIPANHIYTFILSLLLLTGCNTNEDRRPDDKYVLLTNEEIKDLKRDNPEAEGHILFTKGELRGMKLFMRICNRCHPAAEKGKGPSLIDKKIPDFVIHFQVRHGLGDMPSFKEDEISKEDVKKIILFVKALREYEEKSKK